MSMRKFVVALAVLAALTVVGYSAQLYAAGRSMNGENEPAAAYAFTLTTGIVEGRMAFVGAGGDIDGVTNPTLEVPAGVGVAVTLVNGEGMPHDFVAPALGVQSAVVSAKGADVRVVFTTPAAAGTYDYYCSISGHRQAGMSGQIVVR